MKKFIIYFTFIGLIGLLFSCEKDETKVVMLTNPTVPTIQTVPDLTLKRANGKDTLTFVGTDVNPGFQASAVYSLEACAKGNNFADITVLKSGLAKSTFKITVSELNGILIKKFPTDVASNLDLRIKSVLVVDAGTGAKPKEYVSDAKTVVATTYGLPRLDLVGSGITQKIESALGDGKYFAFVKLDKTKAFTLKDPDANIVYGGAAGKLAVNGAAIIPTDTGWFKLNADTKALTYSTEAYMIGLVGSATANGWNSPDTKMDFDAQSGTWKITATLIDGEIKFRLNDGWAWNLGGTPDNLTQGGSNIAVTAGTYTISLTIINGTTGTCKIVKN